MSATQLQHVFEQWCGDNDRLVLASVYQTSGSTYSKTGAQMLINSNGDFQGMLSGGCLEGDLAERAKQVAGSGDPQTVTYDLGQNDDALWGLGVGCDGLIRIFLQPLEREQEFEPLASMLSAYSGDTQQAAVTIIASEHERLQPGMGLVLSASGIQWSNLPDEDAPRFIDIGRKTLVANASSLDRMPTDDGDIDTLLTVLRPIPRVLLLGAGLDAEPVVRLVHELGWRTTINDHRPAYIDNGDFSLAEQVMCVPAAKIAGELDLGRFDAAIVMSHHLVTDEAYLRQLARTSIAYVGLLGPANRRQRLMDSLGDASKSLQGRLRGPAGLEIGADGPASIALSIVAQMHDEIVRRD